MTKRWNERERERESEKEPKFDRQTDGRTVTAFLVFKEVARRMNRRWWLKDE
jgi:hypothetical protein